MTHTVTITDIISKEYNPGKFSVFIRAEIANTSSSMIPVAATFAIVKSGTVYTFGKPFVVEVAKNGAKVLVSATYSPSCIDGGFVTPGKYTARVVATNWLKNLSVTSDKAFAIKSPGETPCVEPDGEVNGEYEEEITVKYLCNDFWKKNGVGAVERRIVSRDPERYNIPDRCINPVGALGERRDDVQKIKYTCTNGEWRITDVEQYFENPHCRLYVKDGRNNVFLSSDTMQFGGDGERIDYFPFGSCITGVDLFFDASNVDAYSHWEVRYGSKGQVIEEYVGYYEILLNGQMIAISVPHRASQSRYNAPVTAVWWEGDEPEDYAISLDTGGAFDVSGGAKDIELQMNALWYTYYSGGWKHPAGTYLTGRRLLFTIPDKFKIEVAPTMYFSTTTTDVEKYLDGESIGKNPKYYIPTPKILTNEYRQIAISASLPDMDYKNTVIMQGIGNRDISITFPYVMLSDVSCVVSRNQKFPYGVTLTPSVEAINRSSMKQVSVRMRYRVLDEYETELYASPWQSVSHRPGERNTNLPSWTVDEPMLTFYTIVVEMQEGDEVSEISTGVDVLPLPKYEIVSQELRFDEVDNAKSEDVRYVRCNDNVYVVSPDSDIHVNITVKRTDNSASTLPSYLAILVDGEEYTAEEFTIQKYNGTTTIKCDISLKDIDIERDVQICISIK